ncbi:hypothetical protein [Rhizobium sp. 11_C7_N12_5]|uniref:hypothetical protein n=1 Tax=Rhizobium sp. 11_C7_N12_5 TaxID=3240770 RepID=UPI003F255AE8
MMLKRGVLIAFGISVLLAGASFFFRASSAPTEKALTPGQQLCVNEAVEIFKHIVAVDAQRANQNASILVKSLSATQNAAASASVIASIDARERQAGIDEDTAYCAKLTSCFSRVDYQKRFNACFGDAQQQRASDKN